MVFMKLMGLEIFIKLIFVTLFSVVGFYGNKDFFNKPFYKNIKYNNEQKIAILGGSNVMYGVSAASLLNGDFDARNYSISHEGLDFSLYISWLSSSLDSSKLIIYSSIDFWKLSESADDLDQKRQYLLPRRPLFLDLYSDVKSKLSFLTGKSTHHFQRDFNSSGDMKANNFRCKNDVKHHDVNKLISGLSENKISGFSKRIEVIKEKFNAEKVVLRVPPLYIAKDDEVAFTNYIKVVVAKLEKEGVEVLIPGSVLYFDKRFVCDAAHHGTDELRKILTRDLSKQLILGDFLPKVE